jgi:hypothetical protein
MPNDSLNPIDHWLAIRKAWVVHLKGFAPLTGIVSAGSIYGEQADINGEPQWPFIRLGPKISSPWTATGLAGSVARLSTHSYHSGPFTDEAERTAAAVIEAMNTFSISTLEIIDMQWVASNTLPDGAKAGAWHSIVDIDLTAALLV